MAKKKEGVVYDEWDFYPHYENAHQRYGDRLGQMLEEAESIAYLGNDPEEKYPIVVITGIGNMRSPNGATMFCYFTKEKRFGILKDMKLP